VPAILLHGQQDLVCPLEGAYTLEQAWPAAQLKILPMSGHLTSEPNMLAAVVVATDEMARWITP
jgi:proline iminopeptidase